MIDFINKMKAKQEDDMEICDMEVDKSFEETITEISENDISQDSQVLLANKHKNPLYLVGTVCRCLFFSWSKVCVGCNKKHTLCSHSNLLSRHH